MGRIQFARIPFNLLKMDQTFAADLGNGDSRPAVVQSIIALEHALGVPILAEGVEQPAQAEALHRLGCELAHGSLFSWPLLADAVPAYLNQARTLSNGTPAPGQRY